MYQWDRLAERLRDLSYLNAGIRLSLTDLRPEASDENGQPRHQEFFSTLGLKEFVQWMDESRTPLIPDIIHLVTESDGVPVEVALTYNTGYSETIHTFVNNINTHEGGTHLDGFRSALGAALKDYGNREKMFEKAKVEIAP